MYTHGSHFGPQHQRAGQRCPAHRTGPVLSTGEGAVLSEHDYGQIAGLRGDPDGNALTRGEHYHQMDIQIVFTVTLSDEVRLEINRRCNKMGRATRAQVRQWYIDHGCSLDSDLAEATAAAGEQDGHGGTVVGVASVRRPLDELDQGYITA